MYEDIPIEIKEFLRKYITSVGQLELLFLLYRDGNRVWTAQQASMELRTNSSLADEQLRQLTKSGLFVLEEGSGHKSSHDPALNQIVDQLLQFYNLKRATVIEFIYSQPLDRIRSFADAFKIKKD